MQIEFRVTSNTSRANVARVAAVFDNDGAGECCNLRAVAEINLVLAIDQLPANTAAAADHACRHGSKNPSAGQMR